MDSLTTSAIGLSPTREGLRCPPGMVPKEVGRGLWSCSLNTAATRALYDRLDSAFASERMLKALIKASVNAGLLDEGGAAQLEQRLRPGPGVPMQGSGGGGSVRYFDKSSGTSLVYSSEWVLDFEAAVVGVEATVHQLLADSRAEADKIVAARDEAAAPSGRERTVEFSYMPRGRALAGVALVGVGLVLLAASSSS